MSELRRRNRDHSLGLEDIGADAASPPTNSVNGISAEGLVGAIQDLSERVSHTLTWHELEEWQKDNEYITAGYRRARNSLRECLRSVYAYLHNETVNIHSHLWGAVLFVLILFTFNSNHISRYELSAGWLDLGVFTVFLSSAVFCLSASAFYHMVGSHSDDFSTRCRAFDYTGIIVLTVGSFWPAMYYAFFCAPHLRTFYLTVITACGLGAAFFVLNPEYGKPTHRGARTKASVFIGLGLSGVVPSAHALAIHGAHDLWHNLGFSYLIASGALYIFGALLYANRIPERFAPGRFDYFFASHQLFHLCVVLAALAHYGGVLKAFDYWHGRNTLQPCLSS
ncbi:HlyIII-domain-containing protein [Punctularia strigosozonata HHB-11173 SS5]|uniref:HlyIII-domain-containing protein n=1 Tax=Punctularia strigosozonata (strain HHB-11173) TaxID=741275 RepID=UPI0004417C74|nr:HlyIII-domain-containing protein [Punctularia strigosozonata HHB-11173 SS5]EIN08395.1 HlyIII-domain-containing protein [Punctularia strigosozonata HHB-11173 SS5]